VDTDSVSNEHACLSKTGAWFSGCIRLVIGRPGFDFLAESDQRL